MICIPLFRALQVHGSPSRSDNDVSNKFISFPPSFSGFSYLRFGDQMLGQLDDGEVPAADGPANLVEADAEQLIRLLLLLLLLLSRRWSHRRRQR